MILFSNYWALFLDSFKAALVLPFASESAFYAMLIFKKHNPYLIFIITLFASVLASIINWYLGYKLQFLKHTKALKDKAAEMAGAEKKWDKYLVWFLLFASFKTLGNPFAVLAGFLRTNFKKFLLLIFIGKFSYYFWWVYFSNLYG